MNALLLIAFCLGGSAACFTLAVIIGAGKANKKTECQVLEFRTNKRRVDLRV